MTRVLGLPANESVLGRDAVSSKPGCAEMDERCVAVVNSRPKRRTGHTRRRRVRRLGPRRHQTNI